MEYKCALFNNIVYFVCFLITRLCPWRGDSRSQNNSKVLKFTWKFPNRFEKNPIGAVVRGKTTTFEDLTRKTLQKKKYKVRSTTLVDGLTTEKISDRLNGNFEVDMELLRSRKRNTQKQTQNVTETKFEPKNKPSASLPSIQRALNDDVEKWRAKKDYERLRQKIAREQAQREL